MQINTHQIGEAVGKFISNALTGVGIASGFALYQFLAKSIAFIPKLHF